MHWKLSLPLITFALLHGYAVRTPLVAEPQTSVRTPWETVRSWNDALYDGDRSLALKLTWSTTTSTKYWKTVGGVEGLIQI